MQEQNKQYQVISRKFRPQKFSSVIGQEAIVATLKNALRSKRIAQAYLFCGCRGTGKTSLARLFAKALNCENLNTDFEPCNECASCLDIAKGRSFSVMEIDGASNRGIDDIRQINETASYATLAGKFKIYIIDEVHMLTKEAFNALLKTLEEPPANVKFFFATTEPHKVLPTIISRCQRYDLSRLSQNEIKQKLEAVCKELGVSIEEGALCLIAKKADGALRDAETLLDQLICFADGTVTEDLVSSHLGVTSKELFVKLDNAIYAQDLSFAFTLVNELYTSGKDISCFVDDLLEHFRNHLCQKLENQKSLYTQDQLLYILDYLINWSQKIQKSPLQRLYLEMVLLHLLRTRYRITLDELTKRLLEQEPKQENVQYKSQPPIKPAIAVEKQVEVPKKEPLIKSDPLEEKLLSAIKTTEEPIAKIASEEKPKILETKPLVNAQAETLMRFAAVQLEGTIKEN